MARDWIDEERDRRQQGVNRALMQSEHAAVNARYPGCTIKHCPICDEPIDDAQTVCSEECYTSLLESEERGPI